MAALPCWMVTCGDCGGDHVVVEAGADEVFPLAVVEVKCALSGTARVYGQSQFFIRWIPLTLRHSFVGVGVCA